MVNVSTALNKTSASDEEQNEKDAGIRQVRL
jgi:hypothetical protein